MDELSLLKLLTHVVACQKIVTGYMVPSETTCQVEHDPGERVRVGVDWGERGGHSCKKKTFILEIYNLLYLHVGCQAKLT